jgi:hypothetical protein
MLEVLDFIRLGLTYSFKNLIIIADFPISEIFFSRADILSFSESQTLSVLPILLKSFNPILSSWSIASILDGLISNPTSFFSSYYLNTPSLVFYNTTRFVSLLSYKSPSNFNNFNKTLLTNSSWSNSEVSDSIQRSAEELSSETRRQRATSPVVGYNFKVGDFYPSTTLKFYPSIFRSLSDLTRGVRRSP